MELGGGGSARGHPGLCMEHPGSVWSGSEQGLGASLLSCELPVLSTSQLCALGKITEPLCASVFSFGKGGQEQPSAYSAAGRIHSSDPGGLLISVPGT